MGIYWAMRTGAAVVIGIMVVGTFLNVVNGLQITELHVPEAVRNGSRKDLVLDCAYSILQTDNPSELVVKWYFNEVIHPAPVYQWIPSQKPQVSGIMKGRLNLDYRASEEPYKMYRAIQIATPTPELSGNYTCKVSTFFNESSKTKRLTIYVPESSLEVSPIKNIEEEAVNVTCTAEGVYPKPTLVINQQDRDQGLESSTVVQHTKTEDGLYDITASVVLEDKDLDSPTTFVCDLAIPDTNYTARASSVYMPGPNAAAKISVGWLLPVGLFFHLRI